MSFTFSRRLAIVAGIALPLLETLRRWDEFPGPIGTWPLWLDDYILGAMLLIAAWWSSCSYDRVRLERGARMLCGVWGIAIGMGCFSLMRQIQHTNDPSLGPDPSGLPHGWMIAIKASLLGLAAMGLIGGVRSSNAQVTC